MRIIGLIHRQAENNRQRPLMLLAKLGERKVAYWPLRNTRHDYLNPDSGPAPAAQDVRDAQHESVRLWSLGAKAFRRLANHGYSLSDAAMQVYLSAAPATRLPF